MGTTETIDIRSDDRLWTPAAAGSTSLSQPGALAELIANSIDWSLLSQVEAKALKEDAKSNKEGASAFLKRLTEEYGDLDSITSKESGPNAKVTLIMSKNSYTIIDYGVGMNKQELENALILRGASNATRPNLRPRKGKFGMGMKSGMLTLGWKISIWTRSIKEPGIERRIDIDCRAIDNRTQKLEDMQLRKIDLNKDGVDENSPLHLYNYDHGTAIRISDLVTSVGGPAIYHRQLGLSFTPDLRQKIAEIQVIDAKTDPKNPKSLGTCPIPVDSYDNTFPNKDFSTLGIKIKSDDGGEEILLRGWLKMLEKGRPGGDRQFGLNLFRRGQLIESYHNTGGVRPSSGLWPKRLHTNHAKLIGELHLDMCSPNYTKAGWDTNSKAWIEVKEKLAVHLSEAMGIAGKPARKLTTSSNRKAWETLFTATSTTIAAVAQSTENEDESSEPTDKSSFSKNTITLKDGSKITIPNPIQTNLGEDEAPWSWYFEESTSELVIAYNLDSQIYKQYASIFDKGAKSDESALLSAWAVFDSLFLCLTDQSGIFRLTPNQALEYRTKWLTVALSVTRKSKVSIPKIGSTVSRSTKADESSKQSLSSVGKKCEKLINAWNPKIPKKEVISASGVKKHSLEDCSVDEIREIMSYVRSQIKKKVDD